MEQREQNFTAERDPDATLVTMTPLFDDEATQVARPVVPLTVSTTPSSGAAVASAQQAGTIPVSGARRSWLLALIFVSALVGSLLGGLGLRLYQERQAAAKAAAATPPAEAPATKESAQQPAPSIDIHSADQTASLPVEAPATVQKAAEEAKASAGGRSDANPVRDAAGDADRHADKPSRGSDKRRDEDEDASEDRAGDEDRGGQRAADDERQRGEVRPRLVGVYGNDTNADREARRAERAERRRARRERDQQRREPRRAVDSVRSIFEGPPR